MGGDIDNAAMLAELLHRYEQMAVAEMVWVWESGNDCEEIEL